jgi:glycerophosphoryl diester phosphodiesterase
MTAFFIISGIVLILLALWLFLIAPGKSSGMEKYKYVKYAHRGLHGVDKDGAFAAENSLTAFERAASLGFGIELDVRVTKDKEVVVFHDNTLDRVTNGTGKVCDHTLDELQKLSLMGTADTVPTFREVLDLVDGRVPLLVELKEDGMDHSIGDLAAKMLSEYKGDYIVESFSPLAFGTVRAVLPDAKCGFLVDKHTAHKEGRTFKHRLVQSFMLNVIARPAFIAINVKRPKLFPLPLIRALFRTPVIAWTVKSAEEELAAYKNGIDGIIFEGYIPQERLAPKAKNNTP